MTGNGGSVGLRVDEYGRRLHTFRGPFSPSAVFTGGGRAGGPGQWILRDAERAGPDEHPMRCERDTIRHRALVGREHLQGSAEAIRGLHRLPVLLRHHIHSGLSVLRGLRRPQIHSHVGVWCGRDGDAGGGRIGGLVRGWLRQNTGRRAVPRAIVGGRRGPLFCQHDLVRVRRVHRRQRMISDSTYSIVKTVVTI